MLVYHGTTLEIKEPKIMTAEIGRDFGFAFYTTDIEEQARRWAVRRARIQSRKEKKAVHAVVNVIANDNVGKTVSYVVQGIMRKEDAVERLKFEKINNQIAFCTELSLIYLTFIKSYLVEETV